MHPITAIKKRLRVVLQTALADVRIYRDRTQLLSEQDGELPAAKIHQRSCDLNPNLTTFTDIGYNLVLDIELLDQNSDELIVSDAVNELLARVHAAIVPAGALALPYVLEVVPLGAGEPGTAQPAQYIRSLPARFAIAHTWNRNNPAVDDPNPESID